MPEPIAINVGFPLGGINKATGFHNQPTQPFQTTPSCLNVWPYEWSSGRARGGVRPGLTEIPSNNFPSVTPYNWTLASWDGGYGLAVTTSGGTYVTTDGEDWDAQISTNPGSTFSSCAVFDSVLYQSSAASNDVKYYNLNTAASGNLTVGTYTSPVGPKGVVPKKCGLVYSHGGRLIFAGDYANPHIIYMSRAGTPDDYDYDKTDSGAAWAASGERGRINKPIVGLLTHGNNCLLVGHIDGTTVILGDMRGGGEISEVDQHVGPLMQSAWCKTESDDTIVMARQGLYRLAPGCPGRDTHMEKISKALPNDLVGIDPGVGDTVSVCYDSRFDGIHIYVDRSSGTDAHYFFDLTTRGFFPMSFAVGTLKLGVHLPGIVSATKSGIIALRASDSGGAYQFDTASSENIASHCYYGPIALGSPLTEGKLVELSATLAENASSDELVYKAAWEVYADQSPQQAFNRATPNFTGSPWTKKGFNFWQNPQTRGVAAYIKVSGTDTNRWCIEEIVGTAYPMAKRRRAS